MRIERVASSGAGQVAGQTSRRERHPVSHAVARGAACLVVLLGFSTLAACDDLYDRDYGRSERFGPGRRGDDDGWGRRHRGHRGRGRDRPDASASSDAGAGAGADAGLRDAGSNAGSTNIDAGSADAGAVAPAGPDAGGDPAIAALSDGQILAVADALLSGEIDQARAAEPLLGDAELIAFVEQTLAEREAARSTLTSLAAAIDIAAEPSAVADEVLAENVGSLEQLTGPDAGAIDAQFLSSRDAVHARALELFAALGAAADAPALQAQLLVLQALEQSALERASELSGSL